MWYQIIHATINMNRFELAIILAAILIIHNVWWLRKDKETSIWRKQ